VVCTKRNRHIAIESLVQVLPARLALCMRLCAEMCALGLMVVIAYYGAILTAPATQITATLNVPQYVVYLVVPVAAALIFIRTLGDCARSLRTLLRGGD
jgi:TRAP-type C4-dicarboxylate transport system permease small subunit